MPDLCFYDCHQCVSRKILPGQRKLVEHSGAGSEELSGPILGGQDGVLRPNYGVELVSYSMGQIA